MKNTFRGLLYSLSLIALIGGQVHAQTVTVGADQTVEPGQTVTVDVTITGGSTAAGVNWALDSAAASNIDGSINVSDGAAIGSHQQVTSADGTASVIYADPSANFGGDGTLAQLQFTVSGTVANGATISLTPDSDASGDGIVSAISDVNGTGVGSFAAGTITVQNNFPITQTDFIPADWTAFDGFNVAPFNFNLGTAAIDGSNDLTLTNSNAGNTEDDGFRVYTFFESRDDLVPFYAGSVNIMEYTVSSNQATAPLGADVRFRGTLLAADPNTFGALPEYQVSPPQPRVSGQATTPILPTTTPRTYRLVWSTDAVRNVQNYKKLSFDTINFTQGITTDLAVTMDSFGVRRYSLADIEANASDVNGNGGLVDFSVFKVAPDNLEVGNLFKQSDLSQNPLPPGVFANFSNPGKAINNAGDLANQELVYTWAGGNANDLVFSFIDTGTIDPGVLTSAYTEVEVQAETLYIVDFSFTADNGAGDMSTAASVPGHRARVNLWSTGEAWLVETQSRGDISSNPEVGQTKTVRVYVLSSATASELTESGDFLNLSFDALNFFGQDADNTNAGETKCTGIRIRSVALSGLTPIE
jgi:hypothetical protein